MARIRTLKPEFFRSRSLAQCSIPARVTFAGLWCEADDTGRGVADADILKGAIWPKDREVTAETVEEHLAELSPEHVRLYEIDGERYYEVVKWEKHQSASYRRGKPVHPAPNGVHDAPGNVQEARERVLELGTGNMDARPADAHESDFNETWELYPRKIARKDALKAYQARRREGISAAQLRGAVVNFAAAMAGRSSEHVMHGSTFFGPNERWKDYLEAPKPTADPSDDRPGAIHCPECGELSFLPGSGRMECACA